MTSLPERILKLAEFDYDAANEYKSTCSINPGGIIRGAEWQHTRLLPLIKSLAEIIEKQSEALAFYATFSPRQHPEGYYEIHIAPGEGGEVRFGKRAREVEDEVKARLRELGCTDV